MGMYDSFHLIGASADRVKCAAGHPQTEELQTKNLDCNMDEYYVFEDRLFCQPRGGREQYKATYDIVDGKLAGRHVTSYEPFLVSLDVCVHTHCQQCDPIVVELPHGGFHGNIDHRFPWCEWSLVFKDGALVSVTPERLATRDDVRKELKELGQMALPDDDRVAKREIERWRLDRE